MSCPLSRSFTDDVMMIYREPPLSSGRPSKNNALRARHRCGVNLADGCCETPRFIAIFIITRIREMRSLGWWDDGTCCSAVASFLPCLSLLWSHCICFDCHLALRSAFTHHGNSRATEIVQVSADVDTEITAQQVTRCSLNPYSWVIDPDVDCKIRSSLAGVHFYGSVVFTSHICQVWASVLIPKKANKIKPDSHSGPYPLFQMTVNRNRKL